jgi:plastocyanin
MRRSSLLLWAALVTTTVVLVGCSSSSPASAGSSAASTAGKIAIGTDQANDHGTEDVAGMSTFELEADNDDGFYFKPTVLTGTANRSITLEVRNEGTAQHNFSIDSQRLDVTIAPGASEEVEVTFPASGTVEFYCSFHRSLGMVGELKVV